MKRATGQGFSAAGLFNTEPAAAAWGAAWRRSTSPGLQGRFFLQELRPDPVQAARLGRRRGDEPPTGKVYSVAERKVRGRRPDINRRRQYAAPPRGLWATPGSLVGRTPSRDNVRPLIASDSFRPAPVTAPGRRDGRLLPFRVPLHPGDAHPWSRPSPSPASPQASALRWPWCFLAPTAPGAVLPGFPTTAYLITNHQRGGRGQGGCG